jgi:hypothetical protein
MDLYKLQAGQVPTCSTISQFLSQGGSKHPSLRMIPECIREWRGSKLSSELAGGKLWYLGTQPPVFNAYKLHLVFYLHEGSSFL